MAEERKKVSAEHVEHHHHPPYVGIYFILLLLTAISFVVAEIVGRHNSPPVVFSIGAVKALLIALFYMHLKYEGRWIIGLVLIPLLIFAIILFVFMPDVLVTVKK